MIDLLDATRRSTFGLFLTPASLSIQPKGLFPKSRSILNGDALRTELSWNLRQDTLQPVGTATTKCVMTNTQEIQRRDANELTGPGGNDRGLKFTSLERGTVNTSPSGQACRRISVGCDGWEWQTRALIEMSDTEQESAGMRVPTRISSPPLAPILTSNGLFSKLFNIERTCIPSMAYSQRSYRETNEKKQQTTQSHIRQPRPVNHAD